MCTHIRHLGLVWLEQVWAEIARIQQGMAAPRSSASALIFEEPSNASMQLAWQYFYDAVPNEFLEHLLATVGVWAGQFLSNEYNNFAPTNLFDQHLCFPSLDAVNHPLHDRFPSRPGLKSILLPNQMSCFAWPCLMLTASPAQPSMCTQQVGYGVYKPWNPS